MLVGKNRVGGEGSCWWERIMWLLQDGKLLQKYDLCTKRIHFFTERTSVRPFLTQFAANYMSSHRAPSPIKDSAGKRPYVKVSSKTDFVEALLNLFSQQ